MRLAVAIISLFALLFSGCAKPEPSVESKIASSGKWQPAHHSHVQVQAQPLGEITNSGLLPVVSFDGKWVAFLRYRGATPFDFASLLAGRAIDGMGLCLRETQENSPTHELCSTGASWPGWAPNSPVLVYVKNKAGRNFLALRNAATKKAQQFSLELRQIKMPAISYSAEKIALIANAKDSSLPRLYVLTLKGQELVPAPNALPDEQHLWPQWTPDGRVVFLRIRGTQAELAHWKPGEFPPEKLCNIQIPTSPIGRYQMLAGLGRPLNANARQFAYYDRAVDRIVLVELDTGKRTELKAQTRAGCWMGSRNFIAATDKELLIFPGGKNSTRLIRGSWLPRGNIAGSDDLILCGRGSHRRVLQLVRMKVKTLPTRPSATGAK